MTPRKWFGVGVRLLGLWEILNGLDELVTYGNVIMRLYTPSLTSPNGFLAHAVEHLLVGVFLLAAAATVANTFYPLSQTSEAADPEVT